MFALLIVVIIIVWAVMSVTYNNALQPVDAVNGKRVNIDIKPGTSVIGIAQQLEEAGLIRSNGAFIKYVKKHDLANNLQAGEYILQTTMSTPEIAAGLQSGKVFEVSVTIREGLTVTDIDAVLVEKGLIERGDFIRCAQECDVSAYTFLPDATNWLGRSGQVEGYLFPDTYFVSANNFNTEQFLQRLLATFEKKVVQVIKNDIPQTGYTLTEIVNMAAMVEKESRLPDEKPIVAGILWKRYEEGIGLGVDATVRYLANKPTAAITVTDLQQDSPYNTRKYRGLPPSPIANPGLQTILATVNPEDSAYYYYLHGNDGQIRYARTNDEHNVNKARYLR